MRNSISDKLTRYLAKITMASIACLLVISVLYSYTTYKKLNAKWRVGLQSFAQNILPETIRDVSSGETDALKNRLDLFVRNGKDQNFQIEITDPKNETLFSSRKFNDHCQPSSIFALKQNTEICATAEIVQSGNVLGRLTVSRDIRTFYSFFLNTNIPALFVVLLTFVLLVLIAIRHFLKIEVLLPLQQLIRNLGENKDLETTREMRSKTYEWSTLHQAIQTYKEKIVDYIKKQSEIHAELKKEQLMSEITAQLAHDIRSPLAALDMMATNFPELDEGKRLLVRNTTARIHNIANNLLDRSFTRNNNVSVQMFSSILRSMLFEKREQYQSNPKISIHEYVDPRTYGAFSKIEINDFKRILSNVIDNAVQSIPTTGFVRVALSQTDTTVIIEVFDNGKGIPSDLLQKVTEKGFSSRQEGKGLGLHFVDQKIREWGGKLEIESTVGTGTTVRLILKKEPPPAWFVSEIVINDEDEYVILDDDFSIHEMWEDRILQAVHRSIKMHHFEDEKTFGDWFRKADGKNKNTLYFFDYELIGNRNSGLDIIENFNITKNSILVTSYYENEDIQRRCEKIGVKMIPKELASSVPIISI